MGERLRRQGKRKWIHDETTKFVRWRIIGKRKFEQQFEQQFEQEFRKFRREQCAEL
jgi:hypothetical protein